jgi:homoserine acetyltransferase
MVRAQRILVQDQFDIPNLYASVGSSMGGMQSLAMSMLFPEYVKRCVSISACARSHPSSIALRYSQRAVILNDPNWKSGFYYPEFNKEDEALPPHVGMKLARMIATIGYRSGPEWESRFSRRKMSDADIEEERQRLNIQHPRFCPEFLIETYLDYQGEKFCLQYDANSLLYVSKAMDLFDMSLAEKISLPLVTTIEEIATQPPPIYVNDDRGAQEDDLLRGMAHITADTLILGVQSDILFPVFQQKEIADQLRQAGKSKVTYYELDSIYGHDTFLMDVLNTGAAIKGHLER